MSTPKALGFQDRVIRGLAYWRHPHFTTGVLVHVVDPADRVLLVQQRWRQRGRWGFPGGFLRPGEAYAEAAIREVKEESSLTITNPELVDVYVQPHARHVDVLMRARVDTRLSWGKRADEATGGAGARPLSHDLAARLMPLDRLEISGVDWFTLNSGNMPSLTVETVHALQRLSKAGHA